MEIRRAILLFAIVLGLAALVTSFTRPTEQQQEREEEPRERAPERPTPPANREAEVRPTPARARDLRFPAGAKVVRRTLESGRAATLVVEVLAPGQVAIDDLGLDAAAAPGTPARFEVLPTDPGRHAISFTPANGADGRRIGVLHVRD